MLDWAATNSKKSECIIYKGSFFFPEFCGSDLGVSFIYKCMLYRNNYGINDNL